MNPTPYLFFNGQCRDAIAFYLDVFGGEVEFQMNVAEAPPEFEAPADRQDWIMHASINFGGGAIMMSDNIFGASDAMAGCSVSMAFATPEEAKAAFDKLAASGEATMAFAPTFWSAGFGTVTDQFGVLWMIDTEQQPEAA